VHHPGTTSGRHAEVKEGVVQEMDAALGDIRLAEEELKRLKDENAAMIRGGGGPRRSARSPRDDPNRARS
jgi:hypothetical protein